ncbi:MAG: hypothetical protein AABY40_04195 [Nanoarchaeota archaeon]
MSLAAGIVGAVCILIAFLLDEFYEKFNAETVPYNLINIFGAGLLIYYAYTMKSWPFVALNVVWLCVAVVKLARISRQ